MLTTIGLSDEIKVPISPSEIFVLLSISGIRIFDSFNLSLTLISSGGFLPDNNLDLIIDIFDL